MKIKEVTGVIDHRILLNFRIDPDVMKRNLPVEFTPKLVNGYAIGGICQVSLSQMRAKYFPSFLGVSSHNAAYRVAVNTSQGDGVYVIKRDTNSWLNAAFGGRVFRGAYAKADFNVSVRDENYRVTISDNRGTRMMSIAASVVDALPEGSVFGSTEEVSAFFKAGNIGWSSKVRGGYDTIELTYDEWEMKPLLVEEFYSSYFSNLSMFPEGSVEFDSAMVMVRLEHGWVSREELCGLC